MNMTLRKLSKELQEIAIDRLNEDPSRVEDDLRHLKEWAKKQPHLNARTDDQWLISFLRGSKYSLEKTKSKLDMHYTMRTLVPEFFSNRDPLLPEIQAVLNNGYLFPLLKLESLRTPRVLLLRAAACEPAKFKPELLIKVILMISDIMLLEDDQFVISGGRVIVDCRDTNLAYAWSPTTMKKSMSCFVEAYPILLKGVHHINAPGIFETLFNLIKPFYSAKLKERVSVHKENNLNDLENFVPITILPKEYGGEGKSVDEHISLFKQKVESYREWFLEDKNFGTDEGKRHGKPKTSIDVFGIEGSFRKLNVD